MSKKTPYKHHPLRGKNSRENGQFVDQDYTEKLSEAELEWLAEFNKRYYLDMYDRDIEKDAWFLSPPPKAAEDEIGSDATLTEVRRWHYRLRNGRRRDCYSSAKQIEMQEWHMEGIERRETHNATESYLVDMIEHKRECQESSIDTDKGTVESAVKLLKLLEGK